MQLVRNSLMKAMFFFRSKRFLADAFRLTAGTAVAQIVTMVSLPLLTRLFSPEEFGVFSLFTVIATTLSTFVCLSYEQSIMLPLDDDQAARLVVGVGAITLFFSVASFALVVLFRHRVVELLKAPELLPLLWWMPVMLLALGCYQILMCWVSRRQKFNQLAVAKVLQAGMTTSVQLGAGVVQGGAAGLMFGYVGGQLIATVVLAWDAVKYVFSLFKRSNLDVNGSVRLLHHYRKFPLYSSWGDVMNAASFHIVPLMLSNRFGTAVVGAYFLGYRLVSVPMSLVGASIKQVLLQRASMQMSRDGRVSSLAEAVIGKSILLWAPFCLFLILFAPRLFSIVFGQKWIEAGRYLQVLAPLFFLQLVVSPASSLLIALQKQHVVSVIQAFLLIGAFGSISISSLVSKNPLVCIAIYSAVECAIYVLYLLFIMKYSFASPHSVIRQAFSLDGLIQKNIAS